MIKDKSSTDLNFAYSQYIPYSEIIKNVQESNCILDVVQENQYGLTQRVFEAYAFNKILITNSKTIINSKLYDPNRIFIIGQDNIDKLSEMIKAKRPEVDKELLTIIQLKAG